MTAILAARVAFPTEHPIGKAQSHCIDFEKLPEKIMRFIKTAVLCIATAATAGMVGCAETRTHEGSGQYVDDSVITTKVKAAIVSESSLKVSEINVETFKGVVQLSGFVSQASDIPTATRVARQVAGVTSVKNSLSVKQ